MSTLPTNPSEDFKRRNPHLYTSQGKPLAQVFLEEMGCLEPPAGKRLRQQTKPLLNKLETEWLGRLRMMHPDADIQSQAIRFRIANGQWYKPDFVVAVGGRWTAWEVKGPKSWRGGFENLKSAATRWPQVRWVLVWKEGGNWRQQEVLA